MTYEIKKLTFPEGFDNPSQVARFFRDLPFVGLDRRAMRQIRRQLENRTADCLLAWGDDPAVLRMLVTVAPLVCQHMERPNSYFIPDDPCAAVFFEEPGDMLSVEAEIAIGRALNLDDDADKEAFGDIYEADTSFGELIHRLVRITSRNG